MLPAKPQWQKLIHWVSPLLVLSLGLHGLVLLIPIPKEPEVREEPPETELLEPIRVSALPKPSLSDSRAEPAAIASPSLTPAPPAAAPEEPERPPVAVPRPSSSLPVQGSTPASPVVPLGENVGAVSGAGNSEGTASTTGKPTKPDLEPQPYSNEGTTTGEASAALSELLSFNTTVDGDPAPLKFIKHPLPLAFPAEDYCFKDYPEPPASVVVVIENGQTGSEIIDGGITQKTGYAAIDKWVDKSIFPTTQGDPNANTNVEIPDVANVNILEWMAGNVNGPLFESDEPITAYTFGVKVTLVGNPCS